jgi:hypothetical protein
MLEHRPQSAESTVQFGEAALPDPWTMTDAPKTTIALPISQTLPRERYPLITAAGNPHALELCASTTRSQPNSTQVLLLDEIKLGRRISQTLISRLNQALALLYWLNERPQDSV